MTFVEFFDKAIIENIYACLVEIPDRVIMIGHNKDFMLKHKARYEKFFLDRGHRVEFICHSVSRSNLEKAVELLDEIVTQYEDCVFDITGGENILSVALGVVWERHKGKNIKIRRFNIAKSSVENGAPELTVEENIRVFGGDIVYSDINGEDTYLWDMSPDFRQDIEDMWAVCKMDARKWNTQIGVLEAADIIGQKNRNGLTVTADIHQVNDYLRRHRASYKKFEDIIGGLENKGLIADFWSDDDTFRITYKNHQVKKCLTKAGQVLEMKVFMTAKDLTDSDGKPVYNDVVNGVSIDWDGVFHDEETDGKYDTENEIDILMMHGMVPIFVSCKNGVVSADELYKLNTVAERFGGKYAKKALVVNSLKDDDFSKYFCQRAKDMGISLLVNIQNMTQEQLERRVSTLWC